MPDASRRTTPVALTIAGSDSGGGAGIQADLKAFARCGVHGASAITAITAQNTVGVSAIHAVPGEIVLTQVRAVIQDIGVDAVKVGMLANAEVAHAVARALAELPSGTPVVVDPVMIAESGARLLEPDAQRILIEEIVPRASVLTPNLPEARVLLGREGPMRDGEASAWGGVPPRSGAASEGGKSEVEGAGAVEGDGTEGGEESEQEEEEARELARAALALGPAAVVLTGGHRRRAVDLFVARDHKSGEGEGSAHRSRERRTGEGGRVGAVEIVEIPGVRHPDGAAHGSGCTHSSILAAQLALGRTPLQAARRARVLAGEAVGRGLRDLGAGAGPVDVLGLEALRESEI